MKGLNFKSVVAAALLILGLPSSLSHAVAYCALRDPIVTIREFFPDYTSYKTHQRKVTAEDKKIMRANYPQLHDAETGFHTLYAVYGSKALLGYVVAGQGKGRFGLNTIAWKLNVTGELQGLSYIRNRGRRLSVQEQADLVELVVDSAPSKLQVSLQGLEQESVNIETVSVIQSALRMQLLIQQLWGDLLEPRKNE